MTVARVAPAPNVAPKKALDVRLASSVYYTLQRTTLESIASQAPGDAPRELLARASSEGTNRMRKPKQPGSKRTTAESVPAGGRAWQRVRQFALQRGLPLPAQPADEKAKGGTATRRVAKRTTRKSTKRASTAKGG